MNINTRDLGFVNYNGQEMNFVNFNGVTIYEAWKKLIASGIPPLTLLKCKANNLLDYRIYGNSVQNGTPTPDTPVEIQSVGYKTPNMIDYTKISSKTLNGITYTNNNNGTFTANGTLTSTLSSLNFTNYIDYTNIKQGVEYYCSCGNDLNNSDRRYYLFVSIKNNSTGSVRYFASYGTKKTFTLSDEEKVTSIELRINTPTGELFSVENEVFKPIFCEASEYVEYEPYGYKIPITISNGTDTKTTNIYLDEPLRKIGDYADYIDFANGKVVRNIKESQINNSSSLSMFSSVTDYSTFFISKNDLLAYGEKYKYNPPVLSNTFEFYACGIANSNSFWTRNYQISSSVTSGYKRVCFTLPNTITNVAEAKQWLADNPINYLYPLNTPIEETIELPTIPTHKGTTIIEVDTTIQPSNMEVTYLGKK